MRGSLLRHAQHAARSTTARSTQHAARSTQHVARSTQHTAHSTQHTAHSTQSVVRTRLRACTTHMHTSSMASCSRSAAMVLDVRLALRLRCTPTASAHWDLRAARAASSRPSCSSTSLPRVHTKPTHGQRTQGSCITPHTAPVGLPVVNNVHGLGGCAKWALARKLATAPCCSLLRLQGSRGLGQRLLRHPDHLSLRGHLSRQGIQPNRDRIHRSRHCGQAGRGGGVHKRCKGGGTAGCLLLSVRDGCLEGRTLCTKGCCCSCVAGARLPARSLSSGLLRCSCIVECGSLQGG